MVSEQKKTLDLRLFVFFILFFYFIFFLREREKEREKHKHIYNFAVTDVVNYISFMGTQWIGYPGLINSIPTRQKGAELPRLGSKA